MRKLLKVLFILFAIFVVAIAGLVITVKVMYPPEKVRQMVEKEASKYAKRDIQVKGASLSLFPVLGIEVKGVRISNTGRSNTIQKPISLWAFLKKQNLDKRYVNVRHNGKELKDVADKDVELKTGDKLRISRQQFRNKEAMFSMDRLFVGIKVMPLLKRQVAIQKISLEKLQLLVEVDSRGSYNFDDLLSPSKPKKKGGKTVAKKKKPVKKPAKVAKKGAKSQPIRLQMDLFEIKNSRIVYRNLKTQQVIILDDINQKLSAKTDSTMKDLVSKGLFEIKKMSVGGRGMKVRKSGMYFMMRHDLKVNLKKANLSIKDFTLGFQKTLLTTRGAINGYNKKARYLNLNISTNTVRLQDLFREVPPALFPKARKMSVKGNAKLQVAIKGVVDTRNTSKLPSVKGSFTINNGMFKYSDLPKSINQMNMDMKFTEDSLNLKKLAFNLGTNPISLRALINHFKKPVVDMALKAKIDLGTLKDAVKMPKGTSATGVIDADITAKGKIEPKNPEKIDVKGKLDLKNIVAVTPSVKKPVQLNGTFKFSNTEVSLGQLVGKIGRSSFTMDMTVRDYLSLVLPKKVKKKTTTVTYTMNSPLLDLNEMLGYSSKGSSSKGSSKKTASKSSSSSSSKSTGDEPYSIPKLPNVKFIGKIRVKSMLYKTLPIKNASIDLTFINKRVRFIMAAGLFEGRFREDISVNLSNPKRLYIVNKMYAKKVEANDFISNFNDLPQSGDGFFDQLKSMDNVIYGRMDVDSHVKTFGITKNQFKKNLSGTITAKLYRGRIKNATILTNMTKTLPKLIQKFLPKLDNIKTKKKLTVNMVVKKGKIHITGISIPARKFTLGGHGTISFDGDLNFKMDMALSKRLSRRILYQQKRLLRGAKGLLGRIGGGKLGKMLTGKVGKMLGGVIIPKDKKGRVVPIMGALGFAKKLNYKFLGFKGAKSSGPDAGGGSGNIVKDAKKALKKNLDKAKRAAMRAARDAKRKAQKMAKKAAADAKRRLNAAKDAAAKKARQAAAKAKAKADAAARKAKAAAKAAANKAKRAAANAAKRARQQAAKKKKALQKKAKDALKKW